MIFDALPCDVKHSSPSARQIDFSGSAGACCLEQRVVAGDRTPRQVFDRRFSSALAAIIVHPPNTIFTNTRANIANRSTVKLFEMQLLTRYKCMVSSFKASVRLSINFEISFSRHIIHPSSNSSSLLPELISEGRSAKSRLK